MSIPGRFPSVRRPRTRCRAVERQHCAGLFLTLFLRGRTSRGLQEDKRCPSRSAQKLAWTLAAVCAVRADGMSSSAAFRFSCCPLYLHAMTFSFLGLFVASSAGEVLFNKEEADILLHRPIAPRALLWAKVSVLVEVSLWLAIAFNLGGFFAGCLAAEDGSWAIPSPICFRWARKRCSARAASCWFTRLCLRWFGRERLDGLMTTAQVLARRRGGRRQPALAAVGHSQTDEDCVTFSRDDLVDRALSPGLVRGA